MKRPICKKDGGDMIFDGYARMGGSHSNYYRCVKCGRVVEVYDRDLDDRETTKRV